MAMQIAVALSADTVVWKAVETGFTVLAFDVLNRAYLERLKHWG